MLHVRAKSRLLRKLCLPVGFAAAFAFVSAGQVCYASPTAPPDAAKKPGKATPPESPTYFVYGYSVQHRALVGYTFGDGANKTLIMASVHGNERNTRPLAEKLIAYLEGHTDSYSGCTVTVLPCLNPDGWAHDTRVNAHAVDLNRNFTVGWHANVPGKLSRGSGPLSEPESAALAALVQGLRPAKVVSIHNPLHLLDGTDSKISEYLADLIAAYNHYPVPKKGVGYPTPGSFGQFGDSLHCAVVTLELPPEPVEEAWTQNKYALLAVIKCTINVTGPGSGSRSQP